MLVLLLAILFAAFTACTHTDECQMDEYHEGALVLDILPEEPSRGVIYAIKGSNRRIYYEKVSVPYEVSVYVVTVEILDCEGDCTTVYPFDKREQAIKFMHKTTKVE